MDLANGDPVVDGRFDTLKAYINEQVQPTPHHNQVVVSPSLPPIYDDPSDTPDELPVSHHYHHSRIAREVYAAVGLVPPDWDSERNDSDEDEDDMDEGDALSDFEGEAAGFDSPLGKPTQNPAAFDLSDVGPNVNRSLMRSGTPSLRDKEASATVERFFPTDKYYDTAAARLARSGASVPHPYGPYHGEGHRNDDPYADDSLYPNVAAVVDMLSRDVAFQKKKDSSQYQSLQERVLQEYKGPSSALLTAPQRNLSNFDGMKGPRAAAAPLNDGTLIIYPHENSSDITLLSTKDAGLSQQHTRDTVQSKPLLQSLLPLSRDQGVSTTTVTAPSALPATRSGAAPDSYFREMLLGRRQRQSVASFFTDITAEKPVEPATTTSTNNSDEPRPIFVDEGGANQQLDLASASSPLITSDDDFGPLWDADATSSNIKPVPSEGWRERRRVPVFHRQSLPVPPVLSPEQNYIPLKTPKGTAGWIGGRYAGKTAAAAATISRSGSDDDGSTNPPTHNTSFSNIYRVNSSMSGFSSAKGDGLSQRLGGSPNADGLRLGMDEGDGRWVTTVSTVLLPDECPGQYHVFSNVCDGKTHWSKLVQLGLDDNKFFTGRVVGSLLPSRSQPLPPLIFPNSSLTTERIRQTFATCAKGEPNREKSVWLDNFSIDFCFTQTRYVPNALEDDDTDEEEEEAGGMYFNDGGAAVAPPPGAKLDRTHVVTGGASSGDTTAQRHRNVVIADPFSWPAATLPGTVADGIVFRNRSRIALPTDRAGGAVAAPLPPASAQRDKKGKGQHSGTPPKVEKAAKTKARSKKKGGEGGPEGSGSVITTCADTFLPLFAVTFVYGVEGDFGGAAAATAAAPGHNGDSVVGGLRYRDEQNCARLATMLDACNPTASLIARSHPSTTEDLRRLIDGRHETALQQENLDPRRVPPANVADAQFLPASSGSCNPARIANRLEMLERSAAASLQRAASTGSIRRKPQTGSAIAQHHHTRSASAGTGNFASYLAETRAQIEAARRRLPADVSGSMSRWCRERLPGWEGPALEHGRFVYYHLSEGNRADGSVLPRKPGVGVGLFPSRNTVDSFVHAAAEPLAVPMANVRDANRLEQKSPNNARASFAQRLHERDVSQTKVPAYYVALRYLPSLVRSEVTRASILPGHAAHSNAERVSSASVEISENDMDRLVEELVYFGQYVRGDGTALGGGLSPAHGFYGESKHDEMRRNASTTEDEASQIARRTALGGDGAAHFERVYERRVLTSAHREVSHPYYRIRQLLGFDYSCMLRTGPQQGDALEDEEVLLIRCPSLETRNKLLLKFQRALVSFYSAIRRFQVDNTVVTYTAAEAAKNNSSPNMQSQMASTLTRRGSSYFPTAEAVGANNNSAGRGASQPDVQLDVDPEEDLEVVLDDQVVDEAVLVPVGMRRTLHMHTVRRMLFECGFKNHSDYISALQHFVFNAQKETRGAAGVIAAGAGRSDLAMSLSHGSVAAHGNQTSHHHHSFGRLFDSKEYLGVPGLLSPQGTASVYNPGGAISIHRCRKDALTHFGSGFETIFSSSSVQQRSKQHRQGRHAGGGSRRRSTLMGFMEEEEDSDTRLLRTSNSRLSDSPQGQPANGNTSSALARVHESAVSELSIFAGLLKSPGIKETGIDGIFNYLVKKARTMVSLKKRRFVGESFNLDLAYIRPDIIAMGYPAVGREALFRNPIQDTIRFMEAYHNPDGSFPVSLQSILHFVETLTRGKYSKVQLAQEKDTGDHAASGAGLMRIWGSITGRGDRNNDIRNSPFVTESIVNTPAMVRDVVRAVAQMVPPPFSMSVRDQAVARVGVRCQEFLTSVDRFLISDAIAVCRYMVSTSTPNYRIYNLCSERCYPQNRFASSFERFPSDDHHPPPFDSIVALCASSVAFLYGGDMHITSEGSQCQIERHANVFHDLDSLLESGRNGHVLAPELFGDDPRLLLPASPGFASANTHGKIPIRVRTAGARRKFPKHTTSHTPLSFDNVDASPIDRVVAIHCKAGKGRTGLMCVALTLFLGQFEDEVFLASTPLVPQNKHHHGSSKALSAEELDHRLLHHLGVPSSVGPRRNSLAIVQRSASQNAEATLDPVTGFVFKKPEGTCSDDDAELADLLEGDSSAAALARMPEWSPRKQLEAAMLSTDPFSNARPLLRALNWYGITRTHNNKGVSISSQMRFLEYFHWYLQSERHRLRGYFNQVLEREYYRQLLLLNGREKAFALTARKNPKAYIKYYHPIAWKVVSRSALRLLNVGTQEALQKLYPRPHAASVTAATSTEAPTVASGTQEEESETQFNTRDDGVINPPRPSREVRFETETSSIPDARSTGTQSPNSVPGSPTNEESRLPTMATLEDSMTCPPIARRLPNSVPIPIHQYTHLLRPPPSPLTALSSLSFSPLPAVLKEHPEKCYLVILARVPNHRHIPIGQREFISTEKDVMEIIFDSRLGVHGVKPSDRPQWGRGGAASSAVKTVRSAISEESSIPDAPPPPAFHTHRHQRDAPDDNQGYSSLLNTTLKPPPFINTNTTAYYGLRNLEVQGELRFMFFLQRDAVTDASKKKKVPGTATTETPKNDKLLFSFWVHTGFLQRQRFGPCMEVYGQNTSETGVLKSQSNGPSSPPALIRKALGSSGGGTSGKVFKELMRLYSSPAATKATHDITRDSCLLGLPTGLADALREEQLYEGELEQHPRGRAGSPLGIAHVPTVKGLDDFTAPTPSKSTSLPEDHHDLYAAYREVCSEVQYSIPSTAPAVNYKGGVVRLYRQQLDGASKENKKMFPLNFCVKMEFVTLQ